MSDTKSWLDEVRARLKAATPGPWKDECDSVSQAEKPFATVVGKETRGAAWMEYDVLVWTENDRKLIAHAPEDLARLLALVDGVLERAPKHLYHERCICACCWMRREMAR